MGHALFAGSFFDATAPRKKAKDRGAICATVFFELCFARGFAPEPSFLTIPYCKAQKQDAAGEDEVYELEFPTPLKPLAIADVCRAKADKEDGVGWIDDVGEAVAEREGDDAELVSIESDAELEAAFEEFVRRDNEEADAE